MDNLYENKANLLSEALVVEILARFINCLSDSTCIIDSTGVILCFNQVFQTNILGNQQHLLIPSSNVLSIYELFDDEIQNAAFTSTILTAISNSSTATPEIKLNNLSHNRGNVTCVLHSLADMQLHDLVLVTCKSYKSTSTVKPLASITQQSSSNCIINHHNSLSPRLAPLVLPSITTHTTTQPTMHKDTPNELINTNTPMHSKPSSPMNVYKKLGYVNELTEYGHSQSKKRILTTTRRTAHRRISDAQKEAENLKSLIDSKKAFVRSIAHEIRTPLNVIVSGLMLLELESTGKDALVSLIADMKLSAQDAIDTIGDFIAYEKLDSNILTLDAAVHNFEDVLRKCVRPFYLQARQAQVELVLQVDYTHANYVNVDEYKINQVLRNLLSNAIKFSKAESRVLVRLYTCNSDGTDVLRVDVRDAGPGISLVLYTHVYLAYICIYHILYYTHFSFINTYVCMYLYMY